MVSRALLFIIFAASTVALAQDAHTQSDPSAALYTASAFAHGFRHGYEAGYHAADRELQLSSFTLQNIEIQKLPKISGYQDSFGPKGRFKIGFEAGFRAGFADSAANRPFRATREDLSTQIASRSDFDSGVEAGALSDLTCAAGKTASYCAGLRAGRVLAGRQPIIGAEVAAASPHATGRE